jgi:hypothetical protein
MKTQFDNALNSTLEAMHLFDENLCCAVYWDDMCKDNAIVMFMEYPGYGSMHAVMKDLHARLSSRLGYPVSVCHNHPTDESVLIHGGTIDAQVYYSDECCKRTIIECCMEIIKGSEGYRDELRSIALGAQTFANMCDKPVLEMLNRIDWDKNPQAQVIQMLVDAYAFTND